MVIISTEHITKTPGVCGGKACIAGRRIRVMDIVVWYKHQGRSAADIAESFSITQADVHAAMAYYLDHEEEIEASFEESRKWDEFGKTQPSKLKEALAKNPELREKFGG
ncbi:MAG: DUF433 domain-containing protein [Gemmataceae bacterium]